MTRSWVSPGWRIVLAFAAAVVVLAVLPKSGFAADPCAAPVTNPVACENTKAGDPPSDWEVDGSGDQTIQGFATQMSVTPGQTISFKIKSATTNFHVDILRLGYYGGDGARMMASNLKPTGSSTQPNCLQDSSTGLIDCGNWATTLSWTVPSTAVSGVYIAHLVRDDTGGDSQIIFDVRDDSSHSDIVVSTSDSTWQAYNTYGGNSLYVCTVACPAGDPAAYKGAYKVSYNRPLNTADHDGRSSLFAGGEYPMIRFLEANGYDVSYLSSVDVATRGNLLLNHKLFISSGHDEYWSASQRQSMEAARDAGVNEAFFSGNEGFWKTRWEPSTDGSDTPDRTLVSYKDSHFTTPQDPVTWTGAWRDSRFTPATTNTPANALTGQEFVVNSGSTAITVPAQYGKLRLWRNTAAATLAAGSTLKLAPETLGYEWDVDADNGYRPPGLIDLSSTTASGLEVFTDYATTTQNTGTATHNLTLYRAPSGALVFGAGTVQWSWGLDADNNNQNPADRNMQQATVNLFADMGAQPATIESGLVTATKSTDTTPPTVTLSSPPATVTDGQKVTLSGTATDSGGVVAGVEVSTDGGTTWHPATGTSSWTYTWNAHGSPAATIEVRATDDSANTSPATAGVKVNVSCPCSLWDDRTTPAVATATDNSSIELGVKFRSDTFGQITGVRFYKGATNTGTHSGSLWSADGTLLATATFTNETASGWQSVTFDKPVDVMPNTTYVASYHAPNGNYSVTSDYFWRQPAPGPIGGGTLDSPPLHAIQAGGTAVNGLFTYGATTTFPVNTFAATNYWVDVKFTPIPAPGQVTNVSAVAGGKTSANVTWSAPSGGGVPTTYTITPYIGSTAQTPTTVTGSPPDTSATVKGLTQGTTYTFTVKASNPSGSGAESARSNTVTPSTAVAPSVPTGVNATAASQSARVSWSTPASDGDSPLTGYVVTPYIGATAQTPVQVDASSTATTVSGLTDGTAYTFTVAARNAVGTSPASTASGAVTPEQTIFDFTTPTTIDGGDANPVELGVKFKADYDGTILGLRFYKAPGSIGPHIGSLWSSDGTLLARATFADESASGWQSVNFDTPVSITAGTTYVASYFATNGHYSISLGRLASAVDNAPLHTIANAASQNGVFMYASKPTFPSNSDGAPDYGVDVMYALPKPGQATNVAATEGGSTSARVTWDPPVGGGPVFAYRVTPYVGTQAQTPTMVSGQPPNTTATVHGLTTGTSYTFKVEAVNPSGSGPVSAASNAVNPSAPVAPGAPTGVKAASASGAAQVSWTAPDSDGDSPITGYTITPYIGTAAQAPTTAGASATSTMVRGLTNGTSYTFKVAAQNAIGIGAQSGASNAVVPQDTIFDLATPGVVDGGDAIAVELGVKFRSDVNGSVTGLRFYKADTNTGTHVGSLWTAGGTLLGRATFTNETGSGWQTVTFDSPVQIDAGTTYIASYYAPNGHYSFTSEGFASEVDNPPLHALADATSSNGLYAYSNTPTMPTSSWAAANYLVDVTFVPDGPPGQVTGVTATAGQGSASVSWTAPASGGRPTAYEVTPYIGTQAQTATTVSGSPPATSTTVSGLTSGQQYTFKVRAIDDAGPGPASDASNAVTPTAAVVPSAPTGVSAEPASQSARVSWTAPSSDGGSPITGYTVTPYAGGTAQTAVQVDGTGTVTTVKGLDNGTAYTFTVKARSAAGSSAESTASAAVTPQATLFDLQTPGVVDSGDGNSVELGVRFRSDVDGTVTGLRFYKAAANTGTHVGSLWGPDGSLLAQATFTNESASGWQSVAFATPVKINADTSYIASYLAPKGHYSTTSNAFANPVDNAPLHALADGASENGLYSYSDTATQPINGFNATNYWVDVLFLAEAKPGQVTGVTATAGQGSANVSWTAPASGGRPTSYVVTPYAGTQAQAPKTVSGSPLATSTTIDGLTPGQSYTFTVQATNAAGSGAVSSASGAVVPEATLFGSKTPVTDDSGDGSSVVLGVKFRSDVAGSVTGVRFYKADSNTGTHVGDLWSTDGTQLAQVTFSGESASGWQTAKFASPVRITAGTTYIVSYLAPNGHYSLTSAAFSSAFDTPPLHALADATSANGVFSYSSTPALPSDSFNATNYFVDVTFVPDSPTS